MEIRRCACRVTRVDAYQVGFVILEAVVVAKYRLNAIICCWWCSIITWYKHLDGDVNAVLQDVAGVVFRCDQSDAH